MPKTAIPRGLTIASLHVITGLDRSELVARAYAEDWIVARGLSHQSRCPRQFATDSLPEDIFSYVRCWFARRAQRPSQGACLPAVAGKPVRRPRTLFSLPKVTAIQ